MKDYAEMVEKVMEEVGEANVETAFGQPRQVGDQMVIPVGKVSYGAGGGAGKGQKPGQAEEGEGGGIGMGAQVKPIGYIDVTPEHATYRPIIDFNTVATIGATLIGLAALRLSRRYFRRH